GRGPMPHVLRVMTWNIAEASFTGEQDPNTQLTAIADRISQEQPDFVFLNEVKNWKGWPFGPGTNQARELGRLTGMHAAWHDTVSTGLEPVNTGYKAVAVLSREPL